MPPSVVGRYLVDDPGDVFALRESGSPIDPDAWGWLGPHGKNSPDDRLTLGQLMELPGFTVVAAPGARLDAGPRQRGLWMAWKPGHAPPAAAQSKEGAGGTIAYFDRLSDALGHVASVLPASPDRSPFLVHDFVGGRRLTVSYQPIPVGPGGEGVVYVVDDGYAIKIGHTTLNPTRRIRQLQTGNPRVIQAVAVIAAASSTTEKHLHSMLAHWHIGGEWFEGDAIRQQVATAGGWEFFLRGHLPPGDWTISLHPQAHMAESGPSA